MSSFENEAAEAEAVTRILDLIGRVRREEDIPTEDLQWVLEQFESSNISPNDIAAYRLKYRLNLEPRDWEIEREVKCYIERVTELLMISQMKEYDKVRMNFIITKFMKLAVPIRGLIRECLIDDNRLHYDEAIQILCDYDHSAYADEYRQFISQVAPWIPDPEYTDNPDALEVLEQQVSMVFRRKLREEIYAEGNCPNGFLREPIIDPFPLAPPEKKEEAV
jgi:hypothetical protein